jgi:hypothetical protein
MKKLIAFVLLGFALLTGTATAVVIPAAEALADCSICN